jgi:hypothetical protein
VETKYRFVFDHIEAVLREAKVRGARIFSPIRSRLG